jgi:hypothetical protein
LKGLPPSQAHPPSVPLDRSSFHIGLIFNLPSFLKLAAGGIQNHTQKKPC